MELQAYQLHNHWVIEGPQAQPLLNHTADLNDVIGECFGYPAQRLLLYPENMTTKFFDLSSGEAGEILQKLRNYRIRLAIVRSAELHLSMRFGELLADEHQGQEFRLCDSRSAALEWLCRD